MYLDRENQFSNAQALTSTAASTDVLDIGVENDFGTGEPMCVMVNVEVAADAANADETYSVALQMDTADSFGSPTQVGSDLTIARGSAAGFKDYIYIPAGASVERYLRLNYTLGGTSPSVTVSAHLIPVSMIEERRDYASGFVVA